MPSTTPILNVKSPQLRGGESFAAESFEARHQARLESTLAPFWVRVLNPQGDQDRWLTYARMDQSTHYAVQRSSNGLPTLLPRFYAEWVPIRKLFNYSCDERPPASALIKSYLRASTAHFGSLLGEAAESLGPLPKHCRFSALIPAAAREEAPFIGKTLRAFAKQTIAPENFEVVVFLNCLDANGRVDEHSRETIAVVEEVMRSHPRLNIRPFFAALPDTELWTIGRIRKLMLDSTVLRAYERSRRHPEHILFTTDADCAAIHPELIEHTLARMKKHPEIDAIRGSIDWDWKALAANPLLLFGVRMMSTLDAHRRLSDPTYGVGTPSFAIRAERYVDAGGYHPLDKVGEDMDLIDRLRAVRSGSSEYIAIARGGPQSRVWTSLRRAERALEIDNTPPQNMWFVDGARFQLVDPSVRQAPAPRTQTFLELLDAPDFEARAQEVATKTILTYVRSDKEAGQVSADELVEILTRLSGIEFSLSEDKTKVTIGNFPRLREHLLHFQRNAEDYWKEQLKFEW